MTTIQRHPKLDVLVEHDVVTHSTARRALAVLRVAFGLTFLWAFVDKLFALGFHTGVNADGVTDRFGPAAWINGGSPTTGFLKFGVPENNPFKGFFNGMAGSAGRGLAVHGRAARHRHRPHARYRHADRRSRRRPDVHADVGGLAAAGEQPVHRRPRHRRHQRRRPWPLLLAGDTWGLGQKWARTGIVRKYGALR